MHMGLIFFCTFSQLKIKTPAAISGLDYKFVHYYLGIPAILPYPRQLTGPLSLMGYLLIFQHATNQVTHRSLVDEAFRMFPQFEGIAKNDVNKL
jgi:hypothetical protein